MLNLEYKVFSVDIIQIELEFGNVGFRGEGKTGVPAEKPLGAETRTNNKLKPHMTPISLIEPSVTADLPPPPPDLDPY